MATVNAPPSLKINEPLKTSMLAESEPLEVPVSVRSSEPSPVEGVIAIPLVDKESVLVASPDAVAVRV